MKVIFPFVQVPGTTMILYPDDPTLFSSTDDYTVPGSLIAEYAGKLVLPLYTYALPSMFVDKGTIINRILNKIGPVGIAAILAAAQTDTTIAGFMFAFQQHQLIDVNYPPTQQGFAYLASKGFINPADIPAYLAP